MSDDFETVRKLLPAQRMDTPSANAALDRIDSRLRAAETRQSNLPSKKWLDAFDEQRRLAHDLEHECDRLRADYTAVKAAHDANAKMHGQAVAYHDAMRRAQDEADRLREELVALRPLVRRFGSQYENDDYDKALEGPSDE